MIDGLLFGFALKLIKCLYSESDCGHWKEDASFTPNMAFETLDQVALKNKNAVCSVWVDTTGNNHTLLNILTVGLCHTKRFSILGEIPQCRNKDSPSVQVNKSLYHRHRLVQTNIARLHCYISTIYCTDEDFQTDKQCSPRKFMKENGLSIHS